MTVYEHLAAVKLYILYIRVQLGNRKKVGDSKLRKINAKIEVKDYICPPVCFCLSSVSLGTSLAVSWMVG